MPVDPKKEKPMSATTPPVRQPSHNPSGWSRHARTPAGLFVIGALLFVAAWTIWQVWLAALIAGPH